MTVRVTGTYDSVDKVRNAEEDLVATGIPQEEIFVDENSKLIKVSVPDTAKPEIIEILNRHEPTQIN